METITRKKLAEEVHLEIGIAKTEALAIVQNFFDLLVDGLVEDEQLKIMDFGSFYLKSKKERIGRNPRTKEIRIITARKVVSWNSAAALKSLVNKTS
jgi:integration host factor subunit alpha